MNIKYINDTGIEQIKAFLLEHHQRGDEFTKRQLEAWAQAAEAQLQDGRTPSIEIKPWDSVHGHTVEFTVSPEGLSTESIED